METFALDTPEKLRHNWPFLTPEWILEKEADGIITKEIEHNSNLTGRGKIYSGQVQARAVWVHVASGEVVAEAHPWGACEVQPGHVYAALGTGIALSSEAQILIATVNGGTMPNILPPEEPEEEPEP